MVKVKDPRKAALEASRKADEGASFNAADVAGLRRDKPQAAPAEPPKADAKVVPPNEFVSPELHLAILADFRVFLTLLWRHLLGVDPAPIMLDAAWNLQHGPDRLVLMAFRGFSKSWIAGAFALWLLYCDPQERIMIKSGGLDRAVASTNWCLQIILTWPVLSHLQPKPNQRQSSRGFDVGPARPEQSPSFHALGIGGQSAGWRSSFILNDDVETEKNSITVGMRDKIKEFVKEDDSVLVPGGRIVFLGTCHDEDSLYNELPKRGYKVTIYPCYYPDQAQAKRYGEKLAPYIIQQIRKLGPSCIGRSTMPSRFSEDVLAKKRLGIGNSEFALQFLLDTSLSDRDKYPLKIKDLMVATLDLRRGPEEIAWSNERRLEDLPVMGFEGDAYHAAMIPKDVAYVPYTRITGAIDIKGRGADELAFVVIAELNGTLFWLNLWAAKGVGYDPQALRIIAKLCVKYRVGVLRIEENFGDGMFSALLRPILIDEWRKFNGNPEKRKVGVAGRALPDDGGTDILEVKASNQMAKERRILSVMEPVTQQHRLCVDRSVIEWDFASINELEGEDTRHRYAAMHQFTHLTRDKDSLGHDDRLDALANAVTDFADILGVDPSVMAEVSKSNRADEEYEKLFGGDADEEMVEDENGIVRVNEETYADDRAKSLRIQSR